MSSLELQFFTFLAVALLGIAVGLLFDLLRTWRRLTRPGPLAAHLGDAFFAAVAGLLVLTAFLLLNWVELRAFLLLGLAAGMGLYLSLASPWVIRALTFLVRTAARAVRAGLRLARAAGGRVAGAVAPWKRPALRRVTRARLALRRGRDLARRLAGILRRLTGFLG